MVSAANSADLMPPRRISHRSEGGPDLNYLYAIAGPSSSFDSHHGGVDDDDRMTIAPTRHRGSHRPIKRGRKSDFRALRGTSLYLGGEEGPNRKIYCIPGHAARVLCIDTTTDEVYPIGPIFDASNMILGGKFKWLRGIVVGYIIYGLPCHADCILRIDTRTDEVSTIDIPYEEYYNNEPSSIECHDDDEETKSSGNGSLAKRERNTPWKYHGGTISPHDGCIYAVPQTSRRVLRIDPANERISFVGPDFVGRCKWYGGVVGKTDGAIYCIPQNACGVLRIDASGVNYNGPLVHHDRNSGSGLYPPKSAEGRVLVTVHGTYPPNQHNWHGAAASTTPDGTIVSVPNNVDTVLCIQPSSKSAYPPLVSTTNIDERTALPPPKWEEPELYILEGQTPSDIATGRHRTDGKYKYLGAMAGTDGCVYCFPSGSETCLQVDTVKRVARSVGPNLRDNDMERLFQNKWQNGLTSVDEGCVYAIPLAAETVLRIRTGGVDEPEVTTWKLPEPSNVLAKWEGGVLASNGVMYCMPNNHKAVLEIVPYCLPSRESLHRANDEREKEREAVREMEKLACLREAERKVAERTKKREQRLQERNRRIEKNKKDDDVGMIMSSMHLKVKKDEGENKLVTTNPNLAQSTMTQPAQHVVLDDDVTTPYKYLSGIPTLRSSAHRVKCSLTHRQHNPNPKGKDGNSTNTTFLPAQLCEEDIFAYSTSEYDFHGALVDLLHKCDATLVGSFRTLADGTSLKPTLDNFVVPTNSLVRECQGGNLERAQAYLSDAVDNDVAFLCLFDDFLVNKVLPRLKERLESTGLHDDKAPISFFYQRPPTVRIQPGPARALVRAHNDAEYGREFSTLLCLTRFYIPC